MDRYSKTGLRLNRSTPRRPPGATPSAPTSAGEEALLFHGTEPAPFRAAWRLGAVHHIGLTVADIERSIRFYRDVLGLTLIRRRPRVDSDYVTLQTGFQGVVLNVASFKVTPDSLQSLELVQYMNHPGLPVETAGNRPGASHLCLTVDDVRTCHADLKAKGVRFKSEPVKITDGPNTGGLVVYFYDPDGYMLELFQMPDSPKP